MTKAKAARCHKAVTGPKIMGGKVVAWRRQCKNMTTDPSGYCHVHRHTLRVVLRG